MRLSFHSTCTRTKGATPRLSLVQEERREDNDIVVIRNDDVGVALSTGQAGVTQRVGDLPQDLNILAKSTKCCLVPH